MSLRTFPQTIHDFSFKKILKNIHPDSVYHFAQYKNQRNHDAFAKMWQDSQDKIFKHKLLVAAEILEKIQHIHFIPEKNEEKKKISVPRIYSSLSGENGFLLLMEFIDGKKLSSFSDSYKVEIVSDSISYLRKISPLIARKNQHISRRSAIRIWLQFQYYFLRSLIHRFATIQTLASFYWTFHKGLFHLFVKSEEIFVHADLGYFDNILVKDDTVYLIDFDIAVFADKNLEIANIFACNWNNENFCNLFLEKIFESKYISTKDERIILQSLIAYSSMVRIALSSPVEQKNKNWKNMLQVIKRVKNKKI